MRGAGAGVVPTRSVVAIALVVAAVAMGACSDDRTVTIVRGADDVQVMSPAEVLDERLPASASAGAELDGTAASGGATTAAGGGATVPQNQDDRPPEVRLFSAFGEFRNCLEDDGYEIQGNLTDPDNPAMQDSAYRDAVVTCAARTDIVSILQEVQATRANLTPEEVEQRNGVFIELRDCLRSKGWTVETSTSEIGLLNPTEFHDAEGELDERDINQCLSEMNIET